MITNKIAIIIGACSKTDFAIASKFVSKNIKPIIICRNDTKSKSLQISKKKLYKIIYIENTNKRSCIDIINALIKEYGHIDIIVNTTEIKIKKNTHENNIQLINNYVLETFLIIKQVTKYIKKDKSLSLININSINAQYSLSKMIAYAILNSTIENITKIIAPKLLSKNIRINFIVQDTIEINKIKDTANNPLNHVNKVTPKKERINKLISESITETVYYLSADMSKHTTGVIIPYNSSLKFNEQFVF